MATAPIVLVVVTAVLLFVSISREPRGDGPLDALGVEVQSLGLPIKVGRPRSFGTLYLVNQGSTAVRLARISFEDPTPGLDLIGALIGPAEDAHIGTDRGFPPGSGADGLVPLAGAVIPAGGRVQVVVGFRVERRGTFTSTGLRLVYTAGDETYEETFPVSLRACAEAQDTRGPVDCPTLLDSPAA